MYKKMYMNTHTCEGGVCVCGIKKEISNILMHWIQQLLTLSYPDNSLFYTLKSYITFWNAIHVSFLL